MPALTARQIATALTCLLLPRRAKPIVLRWLGHVVAGSARIGFSLVLAEKLYMAAGTTIGPFNAIVLRRLVMRKGAYIAGMNYLHGHFSIALADTAAIGNRNVIGGERSGGGIPVMLRLGKLTKLTAGHYVNVSASVIFGDYSILAGIGSQIWTHGFVHDATGPGREEVRGKIVIGNNVYIGSMSCIGSGIVIANAVSVGAHSSVATSLLHAGVYVSQPLRYVARPAAQRLGELELIQDQPFSYRWRTGGGPHPLSTARVE